MLCVEGSVFLLRTGLCTGCSVLLLHFVQLSSDRAREPPGAKLEKKMGCAKVSIRKPSSPDDDGEEEEAGVEGNETGGNHNK